MARKLSPLTNSKCSLDVLAKLGHPAVLLLSIRAGQFGFIEHTGMCSGIDLLLKNEYRPAIKKYCPGILGYSSKTGKSMSVSTSATCSKFTMEALGGGVIHLKNGQIKLDMLICFICPYFI